MHKHYDHQVGLRGLFSPNGTEIRKDATDIDVGDKTLSFEEMLKIKRWPEDNIGRLAAVKAIKECDCMTMNGREWVDLWKAATALIDLQCAEPSWIPVKVGLPPTEEKVLCCTITKKGARNIVIGYYMQDSGLWATGMNSNVIAWMPLPDRCGVPAE